MHCEINSCTAAARRHPHIGSFQAERLCTIASRIEGALLGALSEVNTANMKRMEKCDIARDGLKLLDRIAVNLEAVAEYDQSKHGASATDGGAAGGDGGAGHSVEEAEIPQDVAGIVDAAGGTDGGTDGFTGGGHGVTMDEIEAIDLNSPVSFRV